MPCTIFVREWAFSVAGQLAEAKHDAVYGNVMGIENKWMFEVMTEIFGEQMGIVCCGFGEFNGEC